MRHCVKHKSFSFIFPLVFYPLLKIYARTVIRLYCREIKINKPEVLKIKGPVLFAANHPNSFLDGMILTTLLDEELYSLARGDAFKHPVINKLLRRLRLLPVYRTSEGVENLGHNYTTFDACYKTFKKGGHVLIFSEGRCENEWHLRPLKKGTARLATTAWQNGLPLTVIPLGFNYSSFKKFGKTIHLNFGDAITAQDISWQDASGKQLLQFNDNLNTQLQELVYEIQEDDTAKIRAVFDRNKKPAFYALLLAPAVIGWLLHAPLFYLIKWFTNKHFKTSGHYDSVLHSLLLLAYPIYVLLAVILLFPFFNYYTLLALFVLPFTAWAYVQHQEI